MSPTFNQGHFQAQKIGFSLQIQPYPQCLSATQVSRLMHLLYVDIKKIVWVKHAQTEITREL